MNIGAVTAEELTRSTWERLRSIVAQESDLRIYQVTRDLDFRMIDANQMRMDNIRDVIEVEFSIRISLQEIYRAPHFGALADYVEKLLPVKL